MRPIVAFGLAVWAAFAIAAALALAPWSVSALRPPLSESPAGILVVLARVAFVGLLGATAAAYLLGAAFAGSAAPEERT